MGPAGKPWPLTAGGDPRRDEPLDLRTLRAKPSYSACNPTTKPLPPILTLCNVGRGNNCQAIISLQSVAQLQDTYSKERANALLSGMSTSIILRLGDAESMEFARTAIVEHGSRSIRRTRSRDRPRSAMVW